MKLLRILTIFPTLCSVALGLSAPTGQPTAQQTGFQTGSQTGFQTGQTDEPTGQPSAIPTLSPTPTPTSSPTEELCVVDILLFDLFGDGWGDSQLIVSIGDVEHNVSLECGHCDRVTFSDVVCNISIHMTSPEGSDPTTPWENYWVVGFSGETFVGGYESSLVIQDEEIMGMNLIDYNQTISCDECSHPKPKPKGKGKSGKSGKRSGKGGKGKSGKKQKDGRKLGKGDDDNKKPPAFANSKLYDAQGNGWFVASGWNDVCDSENCAPGDVNCSIAVPNIPNFLVYPRYFILNEAKTEIIHEGTICSSSRGFEFCENVIPHNGDFVFRVAGIEPEDDASTWEFCGKKGGINEELQFTMRNGVCVAGAKLSAEEYCAGLLSNVVISGSLILGGVNAESFTTLDATVLESDLKLLMPTTGVAIKSWTNSDNGLRVHFSANIESDVNLLFFHSNLDNMVSTIRSDLSLSVSNGVFKDQLNNALDAFPNTQNDILRACTEITLEDLALYSVGYVAADGDSQKSSIEIVASPIDDNNTPSRSQDSLFTMSSTGVYALVTLGVVSLAVVAVAVRLMSRKKSHELLPTDSSHEVA